MNEHKPVEVTQQGFVPKEIPAKVGQAITLMVTRTTDQTCAKQIVFAELGIQKDLPLNRQPASGLSLLRLHRFASGRR